MSDTTTTEQAPDPDAESQVFTYRNINTGDVRHYGQVQSRLEALPNWERIPGPPESDAIAAVLAVTRRAEAERAAIIDSAQRRYNEAALRDESAAAIARASAVAPPPGGTAANVTPSHSDPGGSELPGGVLRGDAHRGFVDTATLQARQEEDSLRAQQSGVLARAHGTAPAPVDHSVGGPGAGRQGFGPVGAGVPDANFTPPAPAEGDDGEVKPPAKSAKKDELVAWCVRHRHEDQADLDGLTKDDLWERIEDGPLPAPPVDTSEEATPNP